MKCRRNPKDVRELLPPPTASGGVFAPDRTAPLTVRTAIEYGLPITMQQMMALEEAVAEGAKVDVSAWLYLRRLEWTGWDVRISGLLKLPHLAKLLANVGFAKQRWLHGRTQTKHGRYAGRMIMTLSANGTNITGRA